MADLAIGISKTAVQALVDKVKTAFKEEAELWQIVQRDMVLIQDEFEMMESFLSTADTQRVINNVLSTWVRQVYDLSHQVEDCAEFILHLDTRRSRWMFLLRLLPSFCKSGGAQAQPVDEVVAEIKLLKARVEEVSQRNMRYNLIGDSASKPAVQMQQMTAVTFEILNATEKHSGFMDLTKLITKEGMDLHVISVWGTGGDFGKLSIIRKAYDDSRINTDFKCCAWVKLMYPFSPHDFIENLMAQFYTNSCHQKKKEGESICVHPLSRMGTSASALGMEFKQQVHNHRYLIVLEDVSSMAQWDAISAFLPDMKNGSRIVVSTQQLEIASLCTGKPHEVSELWQFSDEHSVWVFFKDQIRHHSEGFLRDEKYQKRPSFVRDVASDLMNNCVLIGRDQEVDRLSGMITDFCGEAAGVSDMIEDEYCGHVVSVCGTAGVGKSTIVKAVCNRVMDHFKLVGWISVSSDQLDTNPIDFLQRLRLDILGQSTNYGRKYSLEEFVYSIRYHTSTLDYRPCLVVIDGLLSKEHWDLIKGKLQCVRSCIVAITTEDSVAKHCAMTSDRIWEIKPLKEDVAFDLLRQVLPFESYLNEDKVDEVKSTLSKCGGLPKRIVALADYLSSLASRPRAIRERDRKRLHANFIMHELAMESSDNLHNIYSRMRSSFEACPQLLKRCIFYLQIFPEISHIRRGHLVRRWMAEGYSKGIGSSSLEDADKLFDKISQLGMIQQAQRSSSTMVAVLRTAPWQVNYMFLEYIISWQRDEKIFLPLEVSVLDGRCSLSSGRIGQHLSIVNNWERDELVFRSLDFSRLRSLTVSGEWQSFFISNQMRVLRVLDLEGSINVQNSDLDKIGEMVPRLKFLSLRRCKSVSLLPDSVCSLRQLQTLDIKYTSIILLPKSIVKLQKLQYLRAGTTGWDYNSSSDVNLSTAEERSRPPRSRTRALKSWLSKLMPASATNGAPDHEDLRGNRSLKDFHTLGVVDINAAAGEAILKELKNLTRLRKLGVSGIDDENSKAFFSAISGHRYLVSLSLSMRACRSLRVRTVRFPSNLLKLSLDINVYRSTEEIISAAAELENLHTLRLRFNLQFAHLLKFKGRFGQLKTLEIASRYRTHDLVAEFYEETMTTLEVLKIRCSGQMGYDIFSVHGLAQLISLKTVCLKCPCEPETMKGLQQQLRRHPNNPELKMEQ